MSEQGTDLLPILDRGDGAPEPAEGRLDQAVDVVPAAGVDRHGQGAAAQRPHLLGHRLAGLQLAACDNHVGAGAGEGAHHLQPQPAAPAGDQGDLAREVEEFVRHGRLHPFSSSLAACPGGRKGAPSPWPG